MLTVYFQILDNEPVNIGKYYTEMYFSNSIYSEYIPYYILIVNIGK